jgi:hypothetical protein
VRPCDKNRDLCDTHCYQYAGRGFGPDLSVAYDSGGGNGPFGMGCSLPLACITRKTEKGIPKYSDATESDVFILSGSEDLAPSMKRGDDGNWAFEEYEVLRTANALVGNYWRECSQR